MRVESEETGEIEGGSERSNPTPNSDGRRGRQGEKEGGRNRKGELGVGEGKDRAMSGRRREKTRVEKRI